MSGFNRDNYNRLRAYLLKMPRFDWITPVQDTPADAGCVACACARLAGHTGRVNTGPEDIEPFLGCTFDESHALYIPKGESHNYVYAAIARLDEVAAKYGVTPESAPAPADNSERERAFVAALQADADAFAQQVRHETAGPR